MSSRASASRYARALLDVAVTESNPEQVERDLSAFAELLSSNAELRAALTNPAVSVSGKRNIATAIAKRLNAAAPLAKLLVMLAERDRLVLIPDLAAVYHERLLEHQQVVRADVTTATPMTSDREGQLRERLAQITGRRVMMTMRVDPALIGGVVTRIGSTVYDGSVATQLAKMRERLVEQR